MGDEITGLAAGVPYLAVPPPEGTVRPPLVAILHMMDPPRGEAAMAAALPLADLFGLARVSVIEAGERLFGETYEWNDERTGKVAQFDFVDRGVRPQDVSIAAATEFLTRHLV